VARLRCSVVNLPAVKRHHAKLAVSARPGYRVLLALSLLGGALILSSCGDTLQDQPIASNVLEQLVMVRDYPIYWLGGSFQHMAITNVLRDPSGSFTVQYGDCVEGGQSTCVPPLSVTTSPDNSFQPGVASHTEHTMLRGLSGTLAQHRQTIEIPTGDVVVDIYASDPSTATVAAQTIVPINQPGLPGARLPVPLPDSGFASQPLLSQIPPPPPRGGE
jgi:hypothetical protein